MLSDKEEVLASKLELVGSDSWSELQSKLTSNLMIKVKGHKEKMPLSSVRNLAYSVDPVERKNAYIAELETYKNSDDIRKDLEAGLDKSYKAAAEIAHRIHELRAKNAAALENITTEISAEQSAIRETVGSFPKFAIP
jgi:oligoendopeptidase F